VASIARHSTLHVILPRSFTRRLSSSTSLSSSSASLPLDFNETILNRLGQGARVSLSSEILSTAADAFVQVRASLGANTVEANVSNSPFTR
jgi:hypothetical protein